MKTFARVHSFSGFIPKKRRNTTDIEREIARNSPKVPIREGVIELMTGITSTPIADDTIQASDLAKEACTPIIKNTSPDLLIFASASQDISEPATAHILQHKLQLDRPAFDVKNACNSFLNGIEIAAGLVESGSYRNVLVATGEVPSRAVVYSFKDRKEYKASFASLTLGDGGGAVLVSASDKSNILYKKFYSHGENWELAAYKGGGTMHLRDVEHMRFTGDGTTLKNSFLKLSPRIIEEALDATGLMREDIAQFFVHQVAHTFTLETLEAIKAPENKTYKTVEKHGNLASASLPVALWQAQNDGTIKQGDIVFILGLASGTSLGIFILEI